MDKTLPDIIYTDTRLTPIVDSNNSLYQLPLFKTPEYFISAEAYVRFIKACEQLVRTNDKYTKYINFLKTKVGLNYCQVMPQITDEDADIEMHHGPILTLFDYVAITIEYFILKNWKITTFRIADYVLYEHYQKRIQTVMLSASTHEEVHDRAIFLNYKMGFGDLSEYIIKYHSAINEDYVKKINSYIERSMLYDSNDFGIFKLNDTLMKYCNV